MKVIRLKGSTTLYLVESESLSCSDFKCGWSTTAAYKWSEADKCPNCAEGKLERGRYQVDLAGMCFIGSCGCQDYEFNNLPKLQRESPNSIDAMSRTERNSSRCKHILVAREFAKVDENFDELLRALTQQGQEAGP